MITIDIKKRNQGQRISDALLLAEMVYDEILDGKIEPGVLQEAVYLQTTVNRIVWKLNENKNRRPENGGTS